MSEVDVLSDLRAKVDFLLEEMGFIYQESLEENICVKAYAAIKKVSYGPRPRRAPRLNSAREGNRALRDAPILKSVYGEFLLEH